MTSSNLVPIAGAAEHLATTVSHVRRLVYEKKITHYKVAGKLRFDIRDLDQFIEAGRVEARPARAAVRTLRAAK